MAVAAVASHTGIPIVVFAEGHVWAVCPSHALLDTWKQIHVLRYTGEGSSAHFDPIDGGAPTWVYDIVAQMRSSDCSIQVSGGGGDNRVFPFRSWNCGGLISNVAIALSLCKGLLLLQETGLNERSQNVIQHKFRHAKCDICFGAPASVQLARNGAWRSSRGDTPGVAIAWKQ
eukprot:5541017-Amphidinium_carterae.2